MMLNQVTSFYHSSQCNIKPPFFPWLDATKSPLPLFFSSRIGSVTHQTHSVLPFNVEARLMIQTWASADRRRKVRKKLEEEEEEAFDVKTRREGGQVFPSSPKLRLDVFSTFGWEFSVSYQGGNKNLRRSLFRRGDDGKLFSRSP